MKIKEASLNAITEAAALIQKGGLVAFPTETVYGLGANALDGEAVARIFAAKGRPSFNPLIVHVPDLEMAEELAVFDEVARRVADRLWPGPLTLILPKKENSPVAELCTAGLETIALRIPRHPVAQDLLRRAEVPIAAPSANRSGEPSPTAPIHVIESLGDRVDLILAAGKCTLGLESTVVDLSQTPPAILRSGFIVKEDLKEIIPAIDYHIETTERPRSPGQTLRHYAPSIPVRLNAVDVRAGEALLAFGPVKFMGLVGGGAAADLPDTRIRHLSKEGDLHEAAANLFAFLRELDRPEHTGIAVMNIPETGIGIAVNDRLRRAAAAAAANQ
ncbi:MAG: threonylcarbamoyl-AMP synthase [Rhodospirillales bacterium]|nr:threonylcarbamoyl-AMP synthase [Rhodospirillales bacterium]